MKLEKHHFSSLREVQSLDNSIKGHLDIIDDEKARIDHLDSLFKRRESEFLEWQELLSHKRTELKSLEKECHNWEEKFAKAKSQAAEAKNEKQVDALNNETKTSDAEVSRLQDLQLELLEELETLENNIEEFKTFKDGLDSTKAKVTEEVNQIVEKETLEINRYRERISALLEDIPDNLKRTFQQVRKKHRFKQPLVRVINKGCEKCKFTLDSSTCEQVETLKVIQTCNSCDRLFIPFDA